MRSKRSADITAMIRAAAGRLGQNAPTSPMTSSEKPSRRPWRRRKVRMRPRTSRRLHHRRKAGVEDRGADGRPGGL